MRGWQASRLRHSAEVPDHDIVQVQRLTVRLSEQQVQVGVDVAHLALDGILLRLQLAQDFDDSR